MINIDDIKAGYTLGNADAEILRSMAKELEAYRQAFSEPFGHMNIFFEGKETGVVWFDHEACRKSDNYIALYRKPTIPE